MAARNKAEEENDEGRNEDDEDAKARSKKHEANSKKQKAVLAAELTAAAHMHTTYGGLVDKISQVDILVLHRQEHVVLLQILDGLIFRGNLQLDRVTQAGPLEFRDFGGHRR